MLFYLLLVPKVPSRYWRYRTREDKGLERRDVVITADACSSLPYLTNVAGTTRGGAIRPTEVFAALPNLFPMSIMHSLNMPSTFCPSFNHVGEGTQRSRASLIGIKHAKHV